MIFSRVAGLTAIAAAIGGGTMAFFPLRSSPTERSAQVVGDTVALELVLGDSVPLLIGHNPVALDLTRSTDSTVAEIVGPYLVARNPGAAIITTRSPVIGQSALPPGGVLGPTAGGLLVSPQTLLRVTVRTERQSANMVMSEVCDNVDAAHFMMQEPVSGEIPRIHEYHDCQKLIERGQYSAVVGIFASTNVDSVNPLFNSRGYLAAIIVNFIGNKPLRTYGPLNLRPGTTCLIIRMVQGRREAALIPQSQAPRRNGSPFYGDCPSSMSWRDVPRSAIGLLDVHEQRGVDLRNRPIAPPVARWDWDPENRHNYIGVKCDAVTWCEIGPRRFVRSAAAMTSERRPIFKGYYDEQYLAADRSAAQPSSVWGTILPGSDATDKAQMEQIDGSRWYEHATLRLVETARSPSAAYLRYNGAFSSAAAGRGGSPPVMGYPRVSTPAPPTGVAPGAPQPRYSNYQLRPVTKNVYFRGYRGRVGQMQLNANQVRFMSHPGQAKVPTVRWRWKANDEGIWSYCKPDGCCEYTFQ